MTTLDFRSDVPKVDKLQWGDEDFIYKVVCDVTYHVTYHITDSSVGSIIVKKEEIPALIRALQNIDKLD